jgi:cell division protein FtsW (lipid II flippase)
VYAALAVILLALAAFSVLCVHAGSGAPDSSVGQQLKGFLYVGALALLGLALAVLLVGLLGNRSARAEGLAMFGCFTYAIYLLAAFVVVDRVSSRR